ncbi:molybdenum cofactor biosynthesis protein MoaE [Aquimarina litoralis]|uniref:molybdenum cofactor biosynthesis protein MoaE n=1 Tax=Aquimarina litoralis TaxID=584605 RepID=UPI001C57417A|nr:molybdenum cofactor biosynthesis protein MoaE [Aquimarina litoralis]MBW1297673.1 molybdenum cofactor biosynthesis protein MoaE [Aquimarina litoralis]
MEKRKTVFVEGSISSNFIASSIEKHQTKTTIGAHNFFLGQVRADQIEGKIVQAIDYSAYQEMAEDKFYEIQEATLTKFDLTSLHIYHSIGKVEVGEICLFVLVSAAHRRVTFDALEYLVDTIKKEVPIFGKEIFEDETHTWKVNN